MAQLEDVNTTDVADAIRLGCETMCRVFNADDYERPFFGARVRPETWMKFSKEHGECHVPGRHLNALLSAEDALGLEVDEGCVAKHARAAFFSSGGALPLPLNRRDLNGELVMFGPHNIREGFHALYALAHFRHSEAALELAERGIAAIHEYWSPDEEWDFARLENELGLSVYKYSFVIGLARTIGPLVKLYRATGSTSALDLALHLKAKAIAEFFTADGIYNPEAFGTHLHSVTCVMSSLAQLADLTSDSTLMNRVRSFYDKGLWQFRDEVGWSLEHFRPEANPDRGECNNTGDIIETALILGRWGYTEYYGDAERMVRSHLLPSQLRDISFIEPSPNPPQDDGRRDVAQRLRGAFGFPAPYGHQPLDMPFVDFNLDIVGGSVASLCEVYREAIRSDATGHHVNLLFDHETSAVAVQSPYTHEALRVRVKKPAPLWVRLPSWVSPEGMRVEDGSEQPRLSNGYLFFPKPPLNRWIKINFPLATNEITLKHRTHEIRARVCGDEVIAMENFGADLTFFATL